MANILTYNNLLTTLKDIQVRHRQINSFGTGENSEMGTTELIYPVLWVNPISSKLINSENGFNTFELTINIKVGDLVNKDLSNEDDILSDTLQIIQDVIKEIGSHYYYINSKIKLPDDIDIDPFKGVSDEDLTGWESDLKFKGLANQSFCGLPFSGITSSSFPNV